jgi:hypothetical protein
VQVNPVASVSLDLDNHWSYLKTHGDPRWEDRPSYLDVVVPRALDVLDRAGVKATFFVVGHDAATPEGARLVGEIAAAGHEVENHSFEHEPWFHRFDDARVEDELARTEDAIGAATGRRPIGFRGPGYSVTPTLLQMLDERGYRYDASSLPTWIGPLARAYYFRSAKLTAEQREERANLFGSFGDVRRPVQPYRWALGGGRSLLELPVTTFPGLRVPMHVSYVLYAEGVNPRLARWYFGAALRTCRLAHVAPSLLLHPLDVISADDAPSAGLDFFPGMGLPGARKRDLVVDCLQRMQRHWRVGPMSTHVDSLLGDGGASLRQRDVSTIAA